MIMFVIILILILMLDIRPQKVVTIVRYEELLFKSHLAARLILVNSWRLGLTFLRNIGFKEGNHF